MGVLEADCLWFAGLGNNVVRGLHSVELINSGRRNGLLKVR
jgi:hypothetical protein